MARFRIDSIAALAKQMEFASHEIRLSQIAAAEALLHILEPTKAYPIDFVVFRITGYRGKSSSNDLLAGLALQHDLGLLIEQVSVALQIETQSLAEPVLGIDDVTEKFNVTSKTIQRWRRRGLPARRFVFPDGKLRVGFLLSSVERFLSTHREQVVNGANFSQIDDSEREQILRRARRLVGAGGCCVNEIARRIGRRFNRSPLTILHTIRKFDIEHPKQAIFPNAALPMTEDEQSKILRAHGKGFSFKQIAARTCRSRSAIYRVVIDERVARINRRKVRFIDDPLYHDADAAETIEQLAQQNPLASEPSVEERRIPRDLPPYLQELYRTPLLTHEQERALFLKFNFHKYQFVQARRRLEPQFARARDLTILERRLRLGIDTKNAIVRANLRLVVSIARKHLRPGLSLMELISDGNITLLRAVESFDVHKGNRFSTYASFALMKGFARSVPRMQAERLDLHRAAAGTRREALFPEMADTRIAAASDRVSVNDEVRSLLAQLSPRERAVLTAHFGIAQPGDAAPVSYQQLGERFGVSVQRLRKVERDAIDKLREAAASIGSLRDAASSRESV